MPLGTAVNIANSSPSWDHSYFNDDEWQCAQKTSVVPWKDGVIGYAARYDSGAPFPGVRWTAVAGSVAGSVLTLGDRKTLDGTSGSSLRNQPVVINANTVLHTLYDYDTGTGFTHAGTVGGGQTFPQWTLGAQYAFVNNGENDRFEVLAQLSETVYIAGRINQSNGRTVFAFEIDAATGQMVDRGYYFNWAGVSNSTYDMVIVPIDSETFEVYWTTAASNGDLKGQVVTINHPTFGPLEVNNIGTEFTIKNNATYVDACRVNADHTIVVFGDDTQQQNTFAVVVNLGLTTRTQGSYENFNTGTSHTGSVAVASRVDDEFYVVAGIGPNFQLDSDDLRLYKGTTDGNYVIDSTQELADISTATTHTGRRVDICIVNSTAVCVKYDRNDDASEDTYLVIYDEAAVDFQITGASLSKGVGDRLYVVGHTGTELALKVYEYPALTELAAYSMGSVTPAELAARTYWAAPYAPFGIDDQVFVFGRLNDPGGLGLTHLMVSYDAGATFDLVTGDLGTRHIGAVIETSSWKMYYVVNKSGGAELWEYDGSDFLLRSTIPVDAWVEQHGICTLDSNVLIANGSADAQLVVYAAPPFAEWFDITYDHPTANGINAILSLP